MERDIVSKAVDYYKERNCSQISCHLMSPSVMYTAVIVVIRCIFIIHAIQVCQTFKDFKGILQSVNRKMAYLNLFLQCSQKKQDLWNFFLSAIRPSMGYTLVRHTVHSSDFGTRIWKEVNKTNRVKP